MIPAADISQYQSFEPSEDIVIIKMGGGDAGCYYDSKATQHYYAAQRAGKAIGCYWFAGGTDPSAEADFFLRSVSPLAENDVLILDWEVSHPDPVGWCKEFTEHIHQVTGVWPLIYMNTSTCTAHDWSPVLANCGLWIADYRFSPDQTVPCGHPYVMHQYTSAPYDKDMWFGSIEQFKLYGYHSTPLTLSSTIPTPTPVEVSTTTINVPPAPVPAPVVEPKSPPTPTTQPTLSNSQNSQSSPSLPGGWFHALINFLIGLFNFKKGR